MHVLRETWKRIRSEQGGFTLIELLVAMILGLVVIGTSVFVFTAVLRAEPRTSERAAEIQQARVLMERITRELRQGATVSTATGTQLSLITLVDSATCGGAPATTAKSCRVTYTCTTTNCTRLERNPDNTGTSTAVRVAAGLENGTVFTYTPSAAAARYVTITLKFPTAEGGDSITLTDGVALRNPAPPA